MINLYYKDAKAAIVTYSLSDEKSFSSVHYWTNEMYNNTNFAEGGFILTLTGNKSDLPPEKIKISSQDSLGFAKKHSMLWSEVSAKTG